MATVTGGSGLDPPDRGRGNEKWRMPKDKPITREPVSKRQSRSQNRSGIEPVRSGSSGRTSSRPSSKPPQRARDSVEQFSNQEVVTEQDDNDSLQSCGFLHRSARTSPHSSDRSPPRRTNSGVSSIHSEERRREAERIARGEPSPVISAFSRTSSTDTRPVLRRSETLLSEIQEESPLTPGSTGARHDREGRCTTQQPESNVESLSPTSLRRRPRTSLAESPYRERRPLPPARRRLYGPESPELVQAASPFDTATLGWVPNPLQHRDSVLAGRERYVPQNVDIQGASGFLFENMEGQDLDPWLRDDQQVYDDAALDLEPSLPIRTRGAGEIRSGETIPTTGRTTMPAIDSNDVFSDSGPLIGLAANRRSREQTRAEGDVDAQDVLTPARRSSKDLHRDHRLLIHTAN